MCFSKVSILLLYTLSIILISHPPFASSDEVNIKDACDEANSTGFSDGTTMEDCINFLNSDPKYRSADFHGLAKFIMEHAIDQGLKFQNTLSELKKNHTASRAVADCLRVHYPASVSFFRSALRRLDSDSEGAYHDALLASDGIQQCNGAVYDDKQLDAAAKKTILNLNKIMDFLSDISTAAIHLFSKDHPPKKV